MGICYSDTDEPFTGRPVPYDRQNACRNYLTHFSNSLFLTAVCQRPRNAAEKRQALRELDRAERKMAHWQRHPNWSAEAVAAECARLRAEWASSR